ncbi:MAG: diguanylate phosphodiesterase, partial [Sphingomonadales bacterium]|nr:diguanylate phosphodiesterase [Sphingomonadales bacterium]
AAVLTKIGCEEAQGFWFARPMEAAQFAEWLTDRRTSALPLANVA